MAGLTGVKPSASYKSLLRMDDNTNGVDATLEKITDGEGTDSSLQLSTSKALVIPASDTTGVFEVQTGSGDSVLSVSTTNFRVGIGDGEIGDNTLHVKGEEAQSVLKLEQLNVDEPFIRFQCASTASDDSECISTDTTVDESDKFGAILISINGVDKWIRIYDTHS